MNIFQLIGGAILPASIVTLVFNSGYIGTGFVITVGLLVFFAKLGEGVQKEDAYNKRVIRKG